MRRRADQPGGVDLISSSDTAHDDGPYDPERAPDPSDRGEICKPESGLLIIATPIGNLGDITIRALTGLRHAAVIACEDTRTTGRLLAKYQISTPMVAYHEHNAPAMRPRLLRRLAAGQTVALVSDAGTPLISDPGYKLVRACLDAGLRVTALPGPDAATTALVVSGLPTDRYLCAGFLPPRRAARRRAIDRLADVGATLVVYEAPQRLAETLADLADRLGADRPAALARELTKRFEEVRRDTLGGLAAEYGAAGPPRGELTLVVGGAPAGTAAAEAEQPSIDAALTDALAIMSVRDAAAAVAAAHGWPRRRVYARALALADHGGDPDQADPTPRDPMPDPGRPEDDPAQ